MPFVASLRFQCSPIIGCLLQNALIEHLNAELTLGTIRDVSQAVAWIQTTFLFVRVRSNLCPAVTHICSAELHSCGCSRRACSLGSGNASRWSSHGCISLSLQMTRNPGHYGLQLRTSDPAAVKAAIREKFVNTALRQLADHGMVRQTDGSLRRS